MSQRVTACHSVSQRVTASSTSLSQRCHNVVDCVFTETKATLATAMEYLKTRHIGDVTIRDNIEGRYSNLGVSATIPAFESYAYKLDTTAPTVITLHHITVTAHLALHSASQLLSLK